MNLTGDKIELTVNGFNSTEVIVSEQVDLMVTAETNTEMYFFVCAYDIKLCSDIINFSNLQESYPHLEPVFLAQYRYADLETI